MISIVITSFREPKTISRAIESIITQNIDSNYELIVAAPDDETLEAAKKYNVKLFRDPGKGKNYALNLLLKKIKGEIIILTDGDVYLSEKSIQEILNVFKNKKVGAVSGHPVSLESRTKIFGYWSYLLCEAAHNLRSKRHKNNQFLECSGYLWAFRNNIIKKFPLDVGEDTIVPIMLYLKNYKIKYASNAKVYVKYPLNLHEFIKQKRRTAGAHDNISKYVSLKRIPRMKTLLNEIRGGFNLFFYSENFREVFWTLFLFPIRFYIWLNLFYNSKIKRRKYSDAWKRIESTK